MGRFGDGVGVSADLALVSVSGGTAEQAAAAGERACALTGATAGLHLGIAADEYSEDHEFLIRSLLGSEGASLVVGDLISVGQTVRLQVRDADAADAAHDGDLVRQGLAADAVAGFFADGEIGPVAGRSHLHGFTASVLVFP